MKTTETLTAREREVLGLLADGLAHEEIAQRLGIGSETVRTHVRKASSRLGASTRTQAVATALRLGLISDDRLSPASSRSRHSPARSMPSCAASSSG